MASTRRSDAPPLRAVGMDEVLRPPPPKSVAEAARKGTQRELLVSMRDRIADAVTDPKCPPRELAALTKRLQDIFAAIDGIDARGDGDAVARVHELESALRDVAPNHPLLGDVDNAFDASII